MYLLNTPTTIEWVLGRTPNTLLFSDLHLITVNPAGDVVFLTSPIAEEDFTAPTELTQGETSYIFTPVLEGLWTILMVTGTSDSHKVLSRAKLQVRDNVTEVMGTEIT
jgi:hypothetical protein